MTQVMRIVKIQHKNQRERYLFCPSNYSVARYVALRCTVTALIYTSYTTLALVSSPRSLSALRTKSNAFREYSLRKWRMSHHVKAD